MRNHLDLFSYSYPKQNLFLSVIVLIVIGLHLFVLGLGNFWHFTQPTPKPHSKVVVQTISLKHIQSLSHPNQTSIPVPSSDLEVEQPIALSPTEQFVVEPALVKEDIPLKEEISLKPEPIIQKEDTLPMQETPILIEEKPVSEEISSVQPDSKPEPVTQAIISSHPSPPTKKENKPQSKPSVSKSIPEKSKNNIKQQPKPVKKAVEIPKKTIKDDLVKNKQAEETEKKRQQQQLEKKRQQELAAKKKQQELAEIERKRQQEIAASQEAAKQKEQAVLAKAKEKLAKMNETRGKISSSSSVNLEATNLPKEIASLHVDTLPIVGSEGSGDWGAKETSYSDEIAYRLKMSLKLPDYGAVKVKLTLDRTGKVITVETVKSESKKNKAYVESKIPTLLFPSFGQKFQGQSQYTFEFLLQNNS